VQLLWIENCQHHFVQTSKGGDYVRKNEMFHTFRMKNNLFEAYRDFCKAENFFDLTEKVTHWAGVIFGYDKLKVLYLQQNKLVSYIRNIDTQEEK